MQFKIPVTIVSGFLGAGKTTLLTRLIKQVSDRNLAVIINEYGETSIDGGIFRAGFSTGTGSARVKIHELNNSLIAYSDDREFLPTLLNIKENDWPVDNIFLETSGLAVPTAVISQMRREPFNEYFQIDATLVVIDTPHLLGTLAQRNRAAAMTQARENVFQQQINNADVVVLNKIDQLSQDQLLRAEQFIREKAPSVRFVETAYHAEINMHLALDLKLNQETYSTRRHSHKPVLVPAGDAKNRAISENALDGHSHSGLTAHEHGLHTHEHFHQSDPGWLSFKLSSKQRQDLETLRSALKQIATRLPLWRVKGYVADMNGQDNFLVQGVGERVTYTAHNDNACCADSSNLVFIGYHLSREQVAAILSAETGNQWS